MLLTIMWDNMFCLPITNVTTVASAHNIIRVDSNIYTPLYFPVKNLAWYIQIKDLFENFLLATYNS